MLLIMCVYDIIRSYNKLIDEDKYADPRTKNYFLVSRPLTVISLALLYLFFCLRAGPRWMEGRKPYELRTTILLYNLFQICTSLYLSLAGMKLYTVRDWFCEPLDYADTPFNRMVVDLGHLYFVLKLTEFLDTIFFVLRKKFNQISVLHLFHHTLMFLGSWVGLRYCSVGHGSVFGIVNCFVHVIMYSYYLVAGLGPEYKKYLWWKKYITILQLAQFVLVFFHNLLPLFSSCTYPKVLHLAIMAFACNFIYMFGKFYIDAYIKPKRSV